VIFLICLAARAVEYFAIRTDETILAENFIHKLFGIAVLFACIKICQWKFSDIGFEKKGIARNLGIGLLLGLCCFAISYAVEIIMLISQQKSPSIELFVSGFSMTGQTVRQTGVIYVLLCVLMNLINVWMEEGIFRGLNLKILTGKVSFMKANLFAGLLFGVWHWVMPLRSYLDGESSIGNLIVMGIGYVVLAGIMSLKWGMLYKMTGSLWMGVGDHLFNNLIASNLVHVVTAEDADELLIVRIIIAQLLSFAAVCVLYKRSLRKKSET
jgi:membrane protease YdiL (CAAX protease family)